VHRVFVVTDDQQAEWAQRFPDAGVGYIIEPETVAVEADVLELLQAWRDPIAGRCPRCARWWR
jgi:hypothetical protein